MVGVKMRGVLCVCDWYARSMPFGCTCTSSFLHLFFSPFHFFHQPTGCGWCGCGFANSTGENSGGGHRCKIAVQLVLHGAIQCASAHCAPQSYWYEFALLSLCPRGVVCMYLLLVCIPLFTTTKPFPPSVHTHTYTHSSPPPPKKYT